MKPRPLIFGEVLFDRFPDGSVVLGGAPFNVAWHLQGFGASPLFVTRLGSDPPGRDVIEAMESWGLETSGVQRDPERPTGAVEVAFDGKGHSFHILENQAYDFIDGEAATRSASSIEPSLLYHGTLAARSPDSRAALSCLLADKDLDVFMDINLRTPFWCVDDLPLFLKRARWCKINDEEVALVSESLHLAGSGIEELASELQRRFELELIIVTLGEKGAWARSADGTRVRVAPKATVDVVDTVGAGDAFAAVVLKGILSDWPLEMTLSRAQRFASDLCGVRGATVGELAFYHRHQEEPK